MSSALTLYYGDTAANYEAVRTSDEIWKAENETITPVLQRLMWPGEHVLDVAAGTGRWLDHYKAANVRPTLLDVSPDMLAIAARHAADRAFPIDILTRNVLEMPALPGCDWLVATRFFNWIPGSELVTILRTAAASGIRHLAFTARMLDESSTPERRSESRQYWRARNERVRQGLENKGIYYLQSRRRIRHVTERLGFELVSEHLIERARGDIYSLFVFTAGE